MATPLSSFPYYAIDFITHIMHKYSEDAKLANVINMKSTVLCRQSKLVSVNIQQHGYYCWLY